MKRNTIITFLGVLIALTVAAIVAAPALTFGQQASYIILTGGGNKYIKPVSNLWGLQWPGVATTSGAGCLQTLENGYISSTGVACGSGSGSSFSTTSATYWKSLGLAFSTTSTDYWETQQAPRGSSAAFPFTARSYGNSTSTTIGFLNGLISNGSTTITGLTSGFVGNNNGLLYGAASSSLFGYTPVNPTRAINTTYPLQGGGALTGDLTLTNAFSTTSNSGMSAGNLYVGSGGIFQTAASSSIFGYTPVNPTRALTIAGTANQLTSSAGAQDLSADRTWTLSLPSHVIFPGNFQAGNASTTNATSTSLGVTNLVSCDTIDSDSTGSLRCGTDATAAGAANPFTWLSTYATVSAATSSALWLQNSLFASSTIYVGAGGVGSSSVQYGPGSFEWTVGSLGSDNTFRISSSTALAVSPALIIDKNLKITLLQASTTDVSARTASFGGTGTTTILATGALTTPSATIGAATGLALLTSGAVGAYAGASCTNQFPRSTNASGAWTCASVSLSTDITGSLGLTSLAAQAANTVIGNGTGGSAVPTAIGTSTLFGASVTPGLVLGSTGGVWAPMATATCVQITGSAGLCDGDDATGAGGGAFPFTPGTNFGVAVNSTSTPISFTQGIFASSTSRFAGISTISATTSLFSVTGSSTIAGQLNAVGGATLGTLNLSGIITSTASGANVIPFASSTALTVSGTGYFGTASTTALTISSIATGNLLKTTTAGSVIAAVAGTDYVTGAGLASAFPFTPTTNYAVNTSATSTPIWARLGIFASSTSDFDQIDVGSSTISTMATSTFFGNLSIRGNASTTALIVSGIASGNLLKTTTAGSVIAAVAGTDYATVAQIGSAFPFTPTTSFATAANSTSTLMLFTAGITASSTVRMGIAGQPLAFTINSVGDIGIGSSSPSILTGFSIGTSTTIGAAQFSMTYASSTAAAATYTVNWESGNNQRFILNQNTSIIINATSSQPRDGAKYTLKLCQDPTGSRTATFITPEQLVWSGGNGATTTVLATASSVTLIGLIYDARAARYDVVASTTRADARSCLP